MLTFVCICVCFLEGHKTTKSLIFHRCKLCGKTYTNAALLKDHAKEHTAVRNQLKLLNSRRKRPATQQIVTNCSSRSKESKKKLCCSVCDKRFEKPSQLSRHTLTHTGEKPFKCNFEGCGKSFTQKNTLESHVLAKHEKLKP
jgi:uncharacterized Zn-finger protein